MCEQWYESIEILNHWKISRLTTRLHVSRRWNTHFSFLFFFVFFCLLNTCIHSFTLYRDITCINSSDQTVDSSFAYWRAALFHFFSRFIHQNIKRYLHTGYIYHHHFILFAHLQTRARLNADWLCCVYQI